MSEHYPRNVKSVMAWCGTCKKQTPHTVTDRRRGDCQNSHTAGMTKKQREENDKRTAAKEQPALEGL